MLRRLVVVRHAKSDWPMGVPDRNRPLADRGRADAPVMGRHLGALLGPVDLALVSPALRAQETWERLVEGLGAVGRIRTEAAIYEAWGAELVRLVRELPDDARTVVLVGHEPGVSELVLHLADRERPELRERIAEKFPTSAAAVLAQEEVWSTHRRGGAQLEAFVTPRELRAR